jgi:hypothetical protein
LPAWFNEMERIRAFSLIAIVVALLLAIGAVPPVAATSGVTVRVDAPAGVAPESDFTAAITISQVTDFDACNYDVTFDPLVLRLDDITSGLIGSEEIPVGMYNELSPGEYRLIQNIPGLAGVSGSGYLAQLHFHVTGAEGDSSPVGPSNGVISDIAAVAIEATWLEGTVMVATEDPLADPSQESTGSAPLLPPPPPSAGTEGVPVLWLVIGGAVLLGLIILFLVARSRAY